LVLPKVEEGTIFLKPLSPPSTAVTDGDGFGTVEYDGHVLVELWKVVNRLRVELFLI
jgi:hypothetical protein